MSSLPNIFGAKIAQQLNKALSPLVFPLTLTKVESALDPADPTKYIPTEVAHQGKGFKDEKKQSWVSGTLVNSNNDSIVILGASLPAGVCPEPGDKIFLEEKQHTIVPKGVDRDPAGATFTCQVE